MSWENLLKRWAYGADNIVEYLQSVRRQIDLVLDSDRGFNQKIKEMKEEIKAMTKERFDRMKNNKKTSVQYRLAKEYFEEGSMLYERLVNKFGHYAARRARIPNEIIREMARHEHDMEILSLFGLEEPKKYTVDMMEDWYMSGHYDEYEDA
tara:strand:- start:5450 stop:5902 length:453 start_codon:yes stop_codon:yes gene_type:complete